MTIPEMINDIKVLWKLMQPKIHFWTHCFWVGHKYTIHVQEIRGNNEYWKCKCGAKRDTL